MTEQKKRRTIPADGEWPCQATDRESEHGRLVALLYLLLRDRSPGELEELCIQVAGHINGGGFTNPHLERYARSLANYLTAAEVASS